MKSIEMKKLPILFMGGLLCAAAAMAEEAPNRVLLYNTAGNYTGYVTERIDRIGFAQVYGDVFAEVDIEDVQYTSLTLTVQRTDDCRGFKISVIPDLIAKQIDNDLQMIAYVNATTQEVYYEDFLSGVMSGIELSPGTDYRVVTVGIDEYGVEAGVFQAPFSTPAPPVLGNPHVEATTTDRQLTSFTMNFKPNSDVASYCYVAGAEGELEQQYETFAPMFGFTNFSEMLEMWGVSETGPSTYTWTGMAPNTDYEVWIAMRDKNGNNAPCEMAKTSTLQLGGPGEAHVGLKVAKYEPADWNGEMLPSLYISFEPNDQASCYRLAVYPKETFDQYTEPEWREEICQDPPQPSMAHWFFYLPMTTDFQVNTSTTVVVMAAAKNINGEWGPLDTLTYTTPEICNGTLNVAAPAEAGKELKSRHTPAKVHQAGTVPFLKALRPTLAH